MQIGGVGIVQVDRRGKITKDQRNKDARQYAPSNCIRYNCVLILEIWEALPYKFACIRNGALTLPLLHHARPLVLY